jgi:hypothetical protein
MTNEADEHRARRLDTLEGLVLAGKDNLSRVVVSMGANGSPSLKLFKDGKVVFEKP